MEALGRSYFRFKHGCVSISGLAVRLASEGPVNSGLSQRQAGASHANRNNVVGYIAEIGAEGGSLSPGGNAVAGRHFTGLVALHVSAQKARDRKKCAEGDSCRDAHAGGCFRAKNPGTSTDQIVHSDGHIGSNQATIVEGRSMKPEVDVKTGIGVTPDSIPVASRHHQE
jgi:hypothetical protein